MNWNSNRWFGIFATAFITYGLIEADLGGTLLGAIFAVIASVEKKR